MAEKAMCILYSFFTLHMQGKWCICETGSGLILQLSLSVGSRVMPYLFA